MQCMLGFSGFSQTKIMDFFRIKKCTEFSVKCISPQGKFCCSVCRSWSKLGLIYVVNDDSSVFEICNNSKSRFLFSVIFFFSFLWNLYLWVAELVFGNANGAPQTATSTQLFTG